MPSSIVKSFAKKTNKPVSEVERLWNTAKDLAKDMGKSEDYTYIVGILENMLGLKESTLYQELSNLYLKSNIKNFNKFLEDTMVSGDISIDVRPETMKKTKKDEDEEDISKKKKKDKKNK